MVFVYVTFPSNKEAKKITKYILAKKLAVCVNIFPVESIYTTGDKLKEDKEVAAILKTVKIKLRLLRYELAKIHPYEIPCIATIDISNINKEYLKWVKKEVRK